MLHRLNKTRAAKEGVIEPSAADLIRPFVAGPDKPPRYSLHFGKVDKVGVNPKSEYNTPLAVCAYPLTEEIFDQFLRIELPFAQVDAKHLFVLEIKPNARVFYSTERFFNQGVGPEYLDADLSKIEVNAADYTTIAKIRNAPFSTQFFYSTRPSGYYQNKQYFVEGGTAARAAQWGHKLWKMGIDVWVDADREGVLHPSEPSQVMFFNPSSYRVVLSMDNPKNTLEARFGRDWRKRKGIDLTGAFLLYADLRGADLTGADLTGADLRGADLRGADLNGADLNGVYLRDVQYDESTTWPYYIQDVLRLWRGDEDLTGAKLRGANLYYAKLRGAVLTGADLTGANLLYADLIGAKLNGAKLNGANLHIAWLTGADLTGADLDGANLDGAYLRDVQHDEFTYWPNEIRDVLRVWQGDKNLTGAKLRGANLTGAKLLYADLYNAVMSRADLRYADLTRAYLRDADLTRAYLLGAKLTGASLTNADLTGANLTNADLTRAILDDIIYDDSTIWPEGFTPPPSAPRPNRR